MAQKTFRRYEYKYLISPQTYETITSLMEPYMKLDDHCEKQGSYMIHNIYFDTVGHELIQKSLSKPYYKEKLRLRTYKNPIQKGDTVFLELKKKIGGIVNKRRTKITYKEAMDFVKTRKYPTGMSYIDREVLKEIEVFLNRYPVEAKTVISYERVAYFGKNDREFRVTFDKNILSRRNQVDFLSGDYGAELLDENKYLMEVKIIGAMPQWFARLLSEHQIFRTGFSKYGEEYKAFTKKKRSALSA